MTWIWSHTPEAYAYAFEQLSIMTSANLIELAKDWQDHLGERKFNPEALPNDVLADWIWALASSHEHGRNCSNGGHELYLDPQGYWTVDLRDMPCEARHG
jgi:hypothetical protein